MFAYAGLLDENKIGNINTYTIRNRNILEFISLRERNALEFLNAYLSKVMRDSGLFDAFENFFEEQNKHSLVSLRDILMDFIIHIRQCKVIMNRQEYSINSLIYLRLSVG